MRYETVTLNFRTCEKSVIIEDQDLIDDFKDIVRRQEEDEDDDLSEDESDLMENIRECEDYTIINVVLSTFECIESETGDDDSVDNQKIESLYRETSEVIKTFNAEDPVIIYEIGGHGWSIELEVPIEDDDEDFDIDKLSIVDTVVKVGNTEYTATTFLYNNEPVYVAATDIITGSYEYASLYENGESIASL